MSEPSSPPKYHLGARVQTPSGLTAVGGRLPSSLVSLFHAYVKYDRQLLVCACHMGVMLQVNAVKLTAYLAPGVLDK